MGRKTAKKQYYGVQETRDPRTGKLLLGPKVFVAPYACQTNPINCMPDCKVHCNSYIRVSVVLSQVNI